MNRNEFRQYMNEYKQARESNPSLSYWQWKTNKYQDGTDGIVDELKATSRTTLTSEEQQYLLNKSKQRQRMSGAITPVFDIQDAVDFTPIGDAIAVGETAKALKDRNYVAATLGLGSLLLPNIIEKPIRRLLKRTKSNTLLYNNSIEMSKPPIYGLLLSNEQKNVRNNIANSFQQYADYLNSPQVQERIKRTDYGNQYSDAINDFTTKVNTPNNLAPYGNFKINFDRYDNAAAAAVPHNPVQGDFLVFDDYVSNAASPAVEPIINDIMKHEASHYLDRSIDSNLSTNYNNWLADTSNMLSFEEWFNQGITNKYIPHAMPEGIDFNTLSKEGQEAIRDKAKRYYNYISNPTEIHSYLGEVTRNNFANGNQLFPYNSYDELYNAYENPNAQSILSLYRDKNRLFNLLKNDLWMFAPGILLLNNYKEKDSN